MINVQDLFIVTTIAQYRTIKEAGLNIGMPPSTMSRRLIELEKKLQDKLFIRSKNELIPTDAVMQIVDAVEPIMPIINHLTDSIISNKNVISGSVTLSAPSILYQSWISKKLYEALAPFDALRLKVIQPTDSFSISPDCDLAIVLGDIPSSSLIARRLGFLQLVCVCTQEFKQKHAKSIASNAIDKVPFVTSSLHPSMKMADVSDTNILNRLKPRVEVTDTNMLLDAVLNGVGFAMLPSYLVEQITGKGKAIVSIFEDVPIAPVPMSILYRDRYLLSPKQKLLKESVEAIFSDFSSNDILDIQ